MANKLLRALTNNLGFKILAVCLAFILWLAVYNIDDPKQTKTYTANVTVENSAVITEQKKCYEVLDGTNVVTFAVTAKRSVLRNLDDSDFRAVADMSRMVPGADGKTANVPIEISSVRANSSLNYPNRKYLKISLEDLMSKRLVITADTSGEVAEGYALGDVTVTNANVLTVEGPASIVSTIVSAVATIEVEGMSVNLSDSVVPVLYDGEGNEVDTTRLTVSKATVTVSARILVIKEMKLAFSTEGTPWGDYSVVSITADPQSVRVKGATSVLNPIAAITVPSEMLSVEGLREDLTTMIDITEFLPDGVELVDSADAKVAVTVRIEPYKMGRYMISTGNIQVDGLAEGCTLTFRDESIRVSVSALQSDLDRLDESRITGVIDVSGLGPGTHQVTVTLDLDAENYVCQTVTAEVVITDGSQTDEPDLPPDEGEDDPDGEGQEPDESGDTEGAGQPADDGDESPQDIFSNQE